MNEESTTEGSPVRPRLRAAAILSLVTAIAIYGVYKVISPGFPFSVLLAPVIFGQAILYMVLEKIELANAVGEDALLALTWVAGGLALWYVYYRLAFPGPACVERASYRCCGPLVACNQL